MTIFCKRMSLGMKEIANTASALQDTSSKPLTQTKTDPQVVAKLAQVLERSGYPYRKAADNVWVVSFKGKSLVDIQVLVTSVENLIIMGAVIAPKSSMKVGPEMMFKLLKLTHDIDRVKI